MHNYMITSLMFHEGERNLYPFQKNIEIKIDKSRKHLLQLGSDVNELFIIRN